MQAINIKGLSQNVEHTLQFLQGELFLIAIALLFLGVGLFFKLSNRAFAFLGLSALGLYVALSNYTHGQLFPNGSLKFGLALNAAVLASAFLFLATEKGASRVKREYSFFLLFALIGANFTILASNWLWAFLALEILSFASYALVTSQGERINAEAGLKYMLFGAGSSAALLFGIAWVFVITGSFNFSIDISSFAANPILPLAYVLIIAGLCFKMGLFPFHFWLVDVYSSASASTLITLAVIPKVAGVLLAFHALPSAVAALPNLGVFVAILSFASATAGNIMALTQQKLMKMLAYSAVSQMGIVWALLLLAPFNGSSSSIALEFLFVYGIASVLAFALIFLEKWQPFSLSDFASLGIAKWKVFVLSFALLSFVGLPPFAGFMAKFKVFAALLLTSNSSEHSILFWLSLGLALNAALSIFYYLKPLYFSLVKFKMGVRTQVGSGAAPVEGLLVFYFLMSLGCIGLLGLFFFPL